MVMKNLSFFSKMPRFFIFCVVALAPSLASQGIEASWKELVVAAEEYTRGGVSLNDVIEEALIFGAEEELTLKATNLFVSLLNSVFTSMRHGVSFEMAKISRDLQRQLFDVVLRDHVAKKRLAMAVFKEYKKWNITFNRNGEVARFDVVVFASFLHSLDAEFFKGLVGEGADECSPADYKALRKQIDHVVKLVRPSAAGVLARSQLNRVKYSLRAGMQSAAQSVNAAKAAVGRQVGFVSLKGVFRTLGTVSVIGLFFMGTYAVMYRKKVLREFAAQAISLGGGTKEVAKEGLLLYTLPETRWGRVWNRIKEWIYDDPEIRKQQAEAFTKELLEKPEDYVRPTDSGYDELTDLLRYASDYPERVKAQAKSKAKDEWARDQHRLDLMAKKAKVRADEQRVEQKSFLAAARAYREFFMQKLTWRSRFQKGVAWCKVAGAGARNLFRRGDGRVQVYPEIQPSAPPLDDDAESVAFGESDGQPMVPGKKDV